MWPPCTVYFNSPEPGSDSQSRKYSIFSISHIVDCGFTILNLCDKQFGEWGEMEPWAQRNFSITFACSILPPVFDPKITGKSFVVLAFLFSTALSLIYKKKKKNKCNNQRLELGWSTKIFRWSSKKIGWLNNFLYFFERVMYYWTFVLCSTNEIFSRLSPLGILVYSTVFFTSVATGWKVIKKINK